LLKADSPILLTDSGIVIDLRQMQLEKAPSSILVTESGIVIDSRLSHLPKV
jgi:hypothetical protein